MHDLFGDRFFGVREPAWHGLGTVVPEPIPALEAIDACGLRFNISKQPMAVFLPDGQISTLENKHILVRDKTPDDPIYRTFGIVSDEYEVTQNVDIAEVLDKYLTSEYPVETAGALAMGETVFFTLKVGMGSVGGEDVDQYFLVTDSRNGGSSLKIAFTPIRVVCQNTLSTGLAAATVKADIVHRQGARKELENYAQLIGQMKKARELVMSSLQRMAEVGIADHEVDEIIKAAYPDPKAPVKVIQKRVLEELGVPLDSVDVNFDAVGGRYLSALENAPIFREHCRILYEQICDDHPAIAKTPWAAYNAVTEFADWREGGNNPESISKSVLFGYRSSEKSRAFNKAMEFVGAN